MQNKQLLEFSNKFKGENGCVLVIGGCNLYTGAPYAAAMASFLTGADLVYVFTSEDALIPIKVLLPEAIVISISYEEWILKKTNICIIGPGLGIVDSETKTLINKILNYLNERNVFIIVDGCGLRILKDLEIKNSKNVIFTPNVNEKKYIKEFLPNQFAIYKGFTDRIVSYSGEKQIVDSKSCNKRCGGQGDLLCGVIASIIVKFTGELTDDNISWLLAKSSEIVRLAGYKAYKKKGIATILRNIIDEIPNALSEVL